MTSAVANPRTTEGRGGTGRATWHLWGAAAGVLGLVANLFTDPGGSISEAQRGGGSAVVDLVSRQMLHAGAVTGVAAVGCLLVLSAAYRRWSESLGSNSLALRTLPAALTAGAAAMVIGYGFKGQMAIYLPGGLNQNQYPAEGLYTLFMINDLAAFFSWWGVAFAAGCLAWLGLRERLVPRWVGIVSALGFLVPVAFVVGTGLTGFPGVIGPLWLAVVSIGMAVRRPTLA